MIRDLFRRHKLALLLVLLVFANAIRFWPHRSFPAAGAIPPRMSPPPGAPGSPDSFPAPSPEMRQRMEAAWQKLPADQRQAAEQRLQEDRAFFESIRQLPEVERRNKIAEHFASLPPPPGFGPQDPNSADHATGPPGPGPGGPPGAGGPTHFPSPAARRAMDQGIANAQKQNR